MKYFARSFYNFSFLSIMFLVFPTNNYAQQYVQDFSHIGKIIFPSKPKSKILESDTAYTLREQENLYTFIIHSFRNDATFSIDSGSNDLKKLYKGFIKQLTNNSKVSLIYKHKILINGLDGIEIKYITRSSDSLISYTCYHRILYVNRTIYNYGFATLNDSDSTSNIRKEEFLNSFLITEKKENLYQFYEIDDEDKGAAILGSLAAKIIVYGLIFVALYFIFKELKNFFFG